MLTVYIYILETVNMTTFNFVSWSIINFLCQEICDSIAESQTSDQRIMTLNPKWDTTYNVIICMSLYANK